MRYTYVRQHDTTDCAAACLAMVCLHYKKEITIPRLRDMMGTDLKGTNLVGLQKAANELGFTSAAVRVDRENFLSDFSLPCIAQVITEQGMAHFVVVFKKTTIKDDGERRKDGRKEDFQKETHINIPPVLFVSDFSIQEAALPCKDAGPQKKQGRPARSKPPPHGINTPLSDGCKAGQDTIWRSRSGACCSRSA